MAKPGIKRLQKAGVLDDELQHHMTQESVDDIDGATPAQRARAADKLTDDLLTYLFTLALHKKSLEPGVAKVAEAFASCRDV